MNKLNICDDCFYRLCTISTRAARLWMELCTQDFSGGIWKMSSEDFENLRLLELNGYVITTDAFSELSIKILGRMEDEDEITYCCGECDD